MTYLMRRSNDSDSNLNPPVRTLKKSRVSNVIEFENLKFLSTRNHPNIRKNARMQGCNYTSALHSKSIFQMATFHKKQNSSDAYFVQSLVQYSG